MKKKFLSFAFLATACVVGFSFTSCSDDDDDTRYDINSVISFENMVSMKEYVQSGEFKGPNQNEILPGESATITFQAATGQRLMFAMKYGYSHDMFFAPANPGLDLFEVNGQPKVGNRSGDILLWDNGTRINEQPTEANSANPGAVETGNITKITDNKDPQGYVFPAASQMVNLDLQFDAPTSTFTLKITNNTKGTTHETPLSAGTWVVSNVMDGKLVKEEPFYKEGAKSSPQLTALAEGGNNAPLKTLAAESTGIITDLSPVVVVVYSGDINPIYQLNQKDANMGLKELAQNGDASKLKSSLEGMTNVRNVYVVGSKSLKPGDKAEVEFKGWENDRIAYATKFGHSNDWFYANSESIMATFKGDLTNKTVLLDLGTGVNQYPGAGNNQNTFDGIPQAEDKVITGVNYNTYPIPTVANVIKVSIR